MAFDFDSKFVLEYIRHLLIIVFRSLTLHISFPLIAENFIALDDTSIFGTNLIIYTERQK